MQNVAFKEWFVVCEALGTGKQSIILRKGGIAEGREGFAFKHERFYLFPTQYHQQYASTTWKPEGAPELKEGVSDKELKEVTVSYAAKMEWKAVLRDWNQVLGLKEFHIWKPEILEQRFDYETTHQLHLAFVRVYRLVKPVTLPFDRSYGGCRSWVDLKDLPAADVELEPVLTEEQNAVRSGQVRRVLPMGVFL